VTQAPGKRRLVADACVVLKWQMDDEAHVANAIALRDDYLVTGETTVSAPHLLVYELANAIYNAARRARLAANLARQALQNLLDCEIDLQAPPPQRVLDLALELALSAYDAAYVALAEHLGVELWTADRPLYEAASRRFPWVRWIGDYRG
jgi:predicted nucleic acid-binding protein